MTGFTNPKRILKNTLPDSILFSLAPRSASIYSRFGTWVKYGRHHAAPINPLELININPTEVTHRLSVADVEFRDSDLITEIKEGSWDEQVHDITDYDLHQAIVARIQSGVEWVETDFFHRVKNNFKNGEYTKWGCTTFADFINRLDELDTLWRTIDQDGYMTQRELLSDPSSAILSRPIHRYIPPELHEVTVVIARDGELIFYEGRHRFAIASGLELDYIPARVKARHSIWQGIRNSVVANPDMHTSVHNHPDISNLLHHEFS